MKESSGTSFFCYGMAWGINNGILDREHFLPSVEKSWKAISSIVNKKGIVTWGQPPGASPGKTQKSDSTRYGAGICLLALSELISNSKKTSSQLQQVTKILNSIGLNWQETPSQKAAKIIINYLKQ